MTNPLQGMLFPDMRPSAAHAIRGRGRIRGTRGDVDVSERSPGGRRRGHDSRPRSRGDATAGWRPHKRPAHAPQGRAGARPRLLRLANAFSPLYPKGSEEKRLIDAMLLAVPR